MVCKAVYMLVLVTDDYSFHINGDVANAASGIRVRAHYIARAKPSTVSLCCPTFRINVNTVAQQSRYIIARLIIVFLFYYAILIVTFH